MSIDYSKVTQTAYNATVEEYTAFCAPMHPYQEARRFTQRLQPSAHILDLGCGAGRDAAIFTKQGFEVTGIDFSTELLKVAMKAAPLAKFVCGDLRALPFNEKCRFDGVWANASLLHIEKSKIQNVLKKVHDLLVGNGVFYLSVKKGTGEAFFRDDRFQSQEVWKFWSYYQEAEIKALVESAGFSIHRLHTYEAIPPSIPFITIQATKKTI